MNEEISSLIVGVIFLILIINTTMLMSIASTLYGPAPVQYIPPLQSSPYPALASPVNPDPTPPGIPVLASPVNSDPVTPLISLIPTIVPQGNEGAALPDTRVIVKSNGTQPVIQSISSFVTIEPKEAPEIESHKFLQQTIYQKYEEGYITIYSLSNQSVSQALPSVSFSLLNPPLVIDYNVTPATARDIKYIEYKQLATQHEENLIIDRPYENTWLVVTVRDKDTGQIITEDGFGRTYSFQSPRQLVLRQNGNYSIEFTGDYAQLDLTMKVKQEGNFP